MAKEFKEYDKVYSQYKGTALKHIESIGGHIAREDIESIDRWPYMNHFTEAYSVQEIHNAVYGSESWQKFRVSLKGLSTKEKLYALGWYWDNFLSPFLYTKGTLFEQDMIRVNNYLGALKRGRQLDSNLHVVR